MEAKGGNIDREKPRGFLRLGLAFAASARGLAGALRDEASFRQELGFAALVIPIGLWLGHSGVERALLIGPVLLILVVELINSAIEATVDRIGFERHELAGLAKDLGSAAVFVSFVLLGGVWLLVLFGH
jgi:diacylglycerol kinase (ATP)